MDRKPRSKSVRKTLSPKRMKAVKGGGLSGVVDPAGGAVQGSGVGFFKSVGGLKSETDATEYRRPPDSM